MQFKYAWPFIVMLLVAVTALYGLFLWNPIVFDDIYYFVDPEIARRYGHSMFHFDLRWLPYASLGWTAKWFGLDLIWFRLGNLVLHIAVSVSLFFFLRRLLGLVWNERDKVRSSLSVDWLACIPALVFALHPVAVYAVGYLIQRSIVMATLFVLLMLLAFIQGLETGRRRWFVLSALFYFIALFSKEHAIMAPAVALALAVLLKTPSRQLAHQLILPMTLFAIIGVFVVLRVKGLLGAPYELYSMDMLRQMSEYSGLDIEHAYGLSVLTQSVLFFKYLFLWAVPNVTWMSVDMREPFAASYFSWPYLPGLLAFLLWPLVGIKLLLKRGSTGLVGFALLFPWLLFLTEMSTVRIQEPFVLYRGYLWMTGACIVISLLVSRLTKKILITVMPLCLVLLYGLAWERLMTFSHPFLLWNDAAKLVEGKSYLPGMERIYHNRGLALSKTRMKQEAIADYSSAIRMKPDYSYAYNDRGAMYLELHQYAKALKDFDTAITLKPSYPNAYQGRGLAYEALGERTLAQENFVMSCALGRRSCDKLKN